MNLQDKVVLITGSSSGIGKATALRFAKEGARVVVNFKENEKGGKDVLEEIKKIGGTALLIKADVSSPKNVESMFNEIINKFGSIDILINNAGGAGDKKSFEEHNIDEIIEIYKKNVFGMMLCTERFIKTIGNKKHAKIINTSSIRGIDYGGGSVIYSSSKAAVISATKSLAKKLAPNIQVNAVAPGFVKTRNYNEMSEEQIKSFINQTYLKRWVTEDEIADAFVFLAKNDAMTGQVLYVDAGFTLK